MCREQVWLSRTAENGKNKVRFFGDTFLVGSLSKIGNVIIALQWKGQTNAKSRHVS